MASLVATENGERVMRPFMGASLNSLTIFESQSVVESVASDAIRDAFVKWLPEITLDEVTAKVDDQTGSVYINIVFTPPTGEKDSVKIVSGSLNANGEMI